ncbi:MAG: addiction module protein [Bacteroidetes bacterium]|nr:addiction module protein [Bacteroidota bacterium]
MKSLTLRPQNRNDMNIAAEKAEVLKRFEKVSDPSLIKAIKNLLDFALSKQTEEEDIELSSDQKDELNRRLKKYERGEMKFKSWDETRASIKKRAKNAL